MQINEITLPIADIATVSFGLALGRIIEIIFPQIVSKMQGWTKLLFLVIVAGGSLTTFAFAKGYVPNLAEFSNKLDTTVTTAASAVIPPLEPRPSFDCGAAALPGEKFTCSDVDLAAADNKMSATYSSVRATLKDKDLRKKLLDTQRAFNAKLSNAPLDKPVYLAMYKERIAEINMMATNGEKTEVISGASSVSN